MKQLIQQGINVWEIWIEYDQFHPDYFGTLYIHGEILTDRKCSPSFIKSKVEDEQLILKLDSPSSGKYFTREVMYSEPVKNLNQYSSVFIYAGEELIACFYNIEVMI